MLLRSKSVRRACVEHLEVRQLMAAAPIPFKVFPQLPSGTNFVQTLTPGSDGKVYFSSGLATNIGSITPTGTVNIYDTSAVGPWGATDLITGADGNLYFTDQPGNTVGKFNVTTKQITKLNTNFPSFSSPIYATLGPDGNIWSEGFFANILRITPSGSVTQFNYSGGGSGPLINFNGRIYFVSNNQIRTISTSGVFGTTIFQPTNSSGINGLTVGPDGRLWFTERSTDATNNYYGSIDKNGVLKQYPLAKTLGEPEEITSAGDGNLYLRAGDNIVGFTTAGTIIKQQNLGGGASGSGSELIGGPDGNLWFNRNFNNQIGVAYVAGGFAGKFSNAVDGAGIAGVRIFVDINRNGTYDSGEKFVNTKSDGTYRLNVAPGTYALRYTTPSGYLKVGTSYNIGTLTAGGTKTVNFTLAPTTGTPVIGAYASDTTAAQGVFGSPASTGTIQVLREGGSTAAVGIDLTLGGTGVLNTDYTFAVYGATFTYTAATRLLHLNFTAGATGAAIVITPKTVAAGKPERTVTLTLLTNALYRKDVSRLFGTVTIAET